MPFSCATSKQYHTPDKLTSYHLSHTDTSMTNPLSSSRVPSKNEQLIPILETFRYDPEKDQTENFPHSTNRAT